MDCKKIMLEQLAVDYNTSVSDLTSDKNIFVEKKYDERKRAYMNGDAVLDVLCINNIAVFTSTDLNLLAKLKDVYEDYSAEWLFDIVSIHKLDSILKEFGHSIQDLHQYYIPTTEKCVNHFYDKNKWFDQNSLEQFKDDDRFDEALGFNSKYPDMIAVAAMDGEDIMGMAGASVDSSTMWQIGINVDKKYRGVGLGYKLTGMLKAEILKKGILPFYGTAASHIVSHKIAVKAGFEPAWASIYTSKI